MATRAVLFDFGGTLYDYRCFEQAERDSLIELASWSGARAEPEAILQAHRDSMREVFRSYLQQPYFLHGDMFRDAALATLHRLGVAADQDHLEHYRAAQWARHARDFRLREGVAETLSTLKARGLHLGIVSNIDDDQLDHLMTAAGIAPHFDSLLSSEAAGSCKPDQAIYREALRRAGCAAGEVLFVGDTLMQDIAGANRAGMRSVLLWHRSDREPPADAPQPAHVIQSIPEILDLL